MKKIILLLLLGLSINKSFAQSRVTDSLTLLLQKEKTDTNKIKTLLYLAYVYNVSKPDSCIQLAIEALDIARRINYQKGIASSLGLIGVGYTYLGNYAKAMEFLLQSLKVYERLRDSAGISKAYNLIGCVYKDQGNSRQALNYLLPANSLQPGRSDIMANISETYRDMKMIDSARKYSQQALNAAYPANKPRTMGWMFLEMASVHAEAGENDLALTYFRKSIPLTLKVDDYLALCKEYIGIAKVFDKTMQMDSAFFYTKRALFFAQQKNFLQMVLSTGTYLSALYKQKHNTDSALLYMEVAKAANDSLFSQQNLNQFQSLAFDEKLRQQEIAVAELKDKKKRGHNLQYAAIALGLLTFIILFLLLSHSIIANQKLIRFLGVIALLIVFEFINLFIHPYLSHATNDSPLIMLLVMVCIAALLVPLHHRLEKWISHRLVEKNKKIRLEAAKKTIAKLEPASVKTSVGKGEQTN